MDLEPHMEGMTMLRNEKGMTMVETIVAFALLMILLAGFTQVVRSSLNLADRANRIRQGAEQLIDDYYMENGTVTESRDVTVRAQGGKGDFELTLPLNRFQGQGGGTLWYFGEKPEEAETP